MKEKCYFLVLAVFPVGFWLESGKICKNTITHVYFIVLTLAGSLGRCFDTLPLKASCSNSFLGTWQM